MAILTSAPNAARAACEEQRLATTEPVTSTLAGSGRPGVADGDATSASFVDPDGIAVDSHGAIYIADRGGQSIRKIVNDRVTTIAGTSDATELAQVRTGGYINGPAATARFNSPRGVAVASNGDVYVADFGNHAVRKIHAGHVSTVLGSQPFDTKKNLIPDPGFAASEGAPNAWVITATSKPAGGLHRAEHGGPAGSNAFIASASSDAVATSAPIAVQPGTAYTLSVFLDSRGNTSQGNVAFYITDAASGVVYQGFATTPGTNGRVTFSSWNAPKGVTSVRVTYRINKTGISGPVVFAHPLFTLGAYVLNPSAIAIDSSGRLYVADMGTGLRRIDPGGAVTTLTPQQPFVCGVTVRGSGKNLTLGYTDDRSVHIAVAGVEKQSIAFADPTMIEPEGTGHTIGYACGIALFDAYTIAVTDYRTNAVRLIRFPIGAPVESYAMTETLAGGIREGQTAIAGYRDGSTDLAETDVPRGIALDGDKTLIFADSGNRRVREIQHVDARGPQTPDFAGLQSPPNRYRVAVVGASQTFHNVFWQRSIPGRIEAGLASIGPAGPTACPYVVDVRFSGIDVDAAVPLISNYLGDGEMDLVIYLVDIGHGLELKRDAGWKSRVPGLFRSLAKQLQTNHTKLLLVSFPDEKSVSNVEGVAQRDFNAAPDAYDLLGKFHAALAEENAVAASGVPTLRLVRTQERAEEAPVKSEYFESGLNYHASIVGQQFIGNAIVDELRTWRPWARP